MPTIARSVHSRGCVARTRDLLDDGHSSRQLTAAVRAGTVVRARQGRYVCPHLDPDAVSAVRVGGRLTGISAARLLGLWVPNAPASSVQIAVPPHARGLRRPDDAARRLAAGSPVVAVRWTDHDAPGTRTMVGRLEMLDDAIRSLPPRLAFALVESAIRMGMLPRPRLERLLAALPARLRVPLQDAGPASGSGGESLLTFDLRAAGIAFAQQVTIVDAGRVDTVIGTSLVLEADGAEHHATREGFEEDRRRDAVLAAAGYRVLRFSAKQIEFRPDEVMAAIRTAMRQGDHRR